VKFPIKLGGLWYLDSATRLNIKTLDEAGDLLVVGFKVHPDDPVEDLFIVAGNNCPDDVARRACFWSTVLFPYQRLSMPFEGLKRDLFRGYYLERHPGLAAYLEWQEGRHGRD